MSLLTTLFPTGAVAGTRAWCRPAHKTNCLYVVGGSSCCICLPSTATCYVIEMWGQGGGGAGSCCCMGACFGGQAGDYAWVTCAISGTAQTICICACSCDCCAPQAGLFTGSLGQLTRVCNCTTGKIWIVAASACGGSTCCNGFTGLERIHCGVGLEANPYHSNLAITCCWRGFMDNRWCYDGNTYEGPDGGYKNWFTGTHNLPFQQVQGTSWYEGRSCAACACFEFYVRGGCGWTSASQWTTYNEFNNASCGYNQPGVSYGGVGFGRGGTAYAGGMGQCCDCSGNAACQFGGVNGNAPGGGGSSASGTGQSGGCCLGSCGGKGLVLISWV